MRIMPMTAAAKPLFGKSSGALDVRGLEALLRSLSFQNTPKKPDVFVRTKKGGVEETFRVPRFVNRQTSSRFFRDFREELKKKQLI